jgi:hypothetical protein
VCTAATCRCGHRSSTLRCLRDFESMKGSVETDVAERIKWHDALDIMCVRGRCAADATVRDALEEVRDCKHPDAQWLTSLIPRGAGTSRAGLRKAMLDYGDDPRAVFFAWQWEFRLTAEDPDTLGELRRAAAMGYAHAQALLCGYVWCEERLELAQKSAACLDRTGMFELGRCIQKGVGCARDKAKATELYRQAAELGHAGAMLAYGKAAFGELDWQRFYWWGRASMRGEGSFEFREVVFELLPSFEKGEHGRILHTVRPVIHSEVLEMQRVLGDRAKGSHVLDLLIRVDRLYEAMASRARAAIACWSAVGLRHGVVKDVRVMVAKMAWEEVWRWSGKGKDAAEEKKS